MLPITSVYTALILLLVTALAINTTRVRARYLRSDPEAGKAPIHEASRAHGNTLEHSIPVVLLMLLLELHGAPVVALHALGTSFIAARLLYAYGMLRQSGIAAVAVAAGVTYVIEIVLLALLFRAAL